MVTGVPAQTRIRCDLDDLGSRCALPLPLPSPASRRVELAIHRGDRWLVTHVVGRRSRSAGYRSLATSSPAGESACFSFQAFRVRVIRAGVCGWRSACAWIHEVIIRMGSFESQAVDVRIHGLESIPKMKDLGVIVKPAYLH